MKSVYAVIITLFTSVLANAMHLMQAPPPPPPEPNSGGIGGNNVPIDQIGIYLILTFISIVVILMIRHRRLAK